MRTPRILRQLDALTSDAHGAVLDSRQRFLAGQDELSETLATVRTAAQVITMIALAVGVVGAVLLWRAVE